MSAQAWQRCPVTTLAARRFLLESSGAARTHLVKVSLPSVSGHALPVSVMFGCARSVVLHEPQCRAPVAARKVDGQISVSDRKQTRRRRNLARRPQSSSVKNFSVRTSLTRLFTKKAKTSIKGVISQ